MSRMMYKNKRETLLNYYAIAKDVAYGDGDARSPVVYTVGEEGVEGVNC